MTTQERLDKQKEIDELEKRLGKLREDLYYHCLHGHIHLKIGLEIQELQEQQRKLSDQQ